jgi:hypothetical protein
MRRWPGSEALRYAAGGLDGIDVATFDRLLGVGDRGLDLGLISKGRSSSLNYSTMLQTGNRAYPGQITAPPGEHTDPRESPRSNGRVSSRYKVSQRNAWLPPITPR